MEIQIAVIGALGTAFGVIIGFLSFSRNRDKDVRNDAAESAEIKTKLNSIGQGVDSIRIDFKASEKRVSDLSELVIRVDESTKQAHKRIDKLETKGDL